VRSVPAGYYTTYGDVALAAGSPRAARQVGYAMAASGGKDVPWHRVINSQRRISIRGDDERAIIQQELLAAEGVLLDDSGRAPVELRWVFEPPEDLGA